MENTIQLFGAVSQEGKPMMAAYERFAAFFKAHPNKKFIMEITVHEKGSVDAHVWYIIRVIVPAFIRGFKQRGTLMTREEAYNFIINECPAFRVAPNAVQNIFNWRTYKPDCTLPPEELEIAIEWLHYFCVENLNEIV